MKILKFFIFWFFDFVDRFYTLTYASDLFAARGSGHRSRSTHFILSPQVAVILNDFPLARISAQSHAISDRKFHGRNIFPQFFSVQTAPISHTIPHAAVRRRLAECSGTLLSRGKAGHRRAARISAQSHAISKDAKNVTRENENVKTKT